MTFEVWAQSVAKYISAELGEAFGVVACTRLSGGAVQENRLLVLKDKDGVERRFVVRLPAPSGIDESRPLDQQFALQRAAFDAGVPVPEPHLLCTDPHVAGTPFAVMAFVPGVALGPRVVKSGPHEEAARQLGRALATIHAIRPPRDDLAVLGAPPLNPALAVVGRVCAYLDAADWVRPALEWALRWLELNAPEPGDIVLAHRDFRTGNYLVDGETVTAVLDWEFSGWSDPREDLGWFCAKCWRFGVNALEAGGIADRETLVTAYEEASGRPIDRASLRYWEVLAHVRWAMIALQQTARHITGAQRDLELALIYHRVAELEQEAVAMTGDRR